MILTSSSSLCRSASPCRSLVLQFALWARRIAQQAIDKAEAGDYSEVRRGPSFRKPGLALGCVVVVVCKCSLCKCSKCTFKSTAMCTFPISPLSFGCTIISRPPIFCSWPTPVSSTANSAFIAQVRRVLQLLEHPFDEDSAERLAADEAAAVAGAGSDAACMRLPDYGGPVPGAYKKLCVSCSS